MQAFDDHHSRQLSRARREPELPPQRQLCRAQRELALLASKQLCRAQRELVPKMLLIEELQIEMTQTPLTQ